MMFYISNNDENDNYNDIVAFCDVMMEQGRRTLFRLEKNVESFNAQTNLYDRICFMMSL